MHTRQFCFYEKTQEKWEPHMNFISSKTKVKCAWYFCKCWQMEWRFRQWRATQQKTKSICHYGPVLHWRMPAPPWQASTINWPFFRGQNVFFSTLLFLHSPFLHVLFNHLSQNKNLRTTLKLGEVFHLNLSFSHYLLWTILQSHMALCCIIISAA